MSEARLGLVDRLALELAVFMATEVVMSDDVKMMARIAAEVAPRVATDSPVFAIAVRLSDAAAAGDPVSRSSAIWALRMGVAEYFRARIGHDYERMRAPG